jgi:diguanylate cyclase (GGDEF)-like protein
MVTLTKSLVSRVARFLAARPGIVIPDEYAGWIRAQQINVFKRFGYLVVAANALNITLLAILFWNSPEHWGVTIWAGAVAVLMLVYTYRLMLGGRRAPRATRSKRAIRNAARDAAMLGVAWGLMPALFYIGVDEDGDSIIAMVTVGMMCGGAFMLSTMPLAARAFVVPLAIGGLIACFRESGLQAPLMGGLLLIYTATLLWGVSWAYREFIGRLIGERRAMEQSEVIGMLLRDFEESASDWLWSTDTDGRLTSGGRRFAELASYPEADFDGVLLCDLFTGDAATDQLETAMVGRRSFADCTLGLSNRDGTVWISLAGKPVFRYGAFAGYQGVASDVTVKRESAGRIEHLATHDTLTDLINRTTLLKLLNEAIARVTTDERAAALLLIDLDRFRFINDALGQRAGDAFLIEIADRIRIATGSSGVVCRVGGDEFAVLLGPDEGDAAAIADEILDLVQCPFDIGGARVACSAGIGIRYLDSTDKSGARLLGEAELTLNHAKSFGRGSIVVFDRAMEIEAQNIVQLERDLGKALEDDQLALNFQPITSSQTGAIVGCEALLRWRHPTRGIVSPDRFVKIAEACGLILPIGEWIIRSAIASAAKMNPRIKVAINVSPIQLLSPNLVSVFAEALAASGVDPARIDVEITESVLMSDTDTNLSVLASLRELGLGINLDDFGTGYSSFNYLNKFAFDKLKIDKSFVDPLVEEAPGPASIVAAMVTLAHALGMRTVAEGIETKAQAARIRSLTCDEMQGYFFSRPVPLDAFLLLPGTAPDASLASQSRLTG